METANQETMPSRESTCFFPTRNGRRYSQIPPQVLVCPPARESMSPLRESKCNSSLSQVKALVSKDEDGDEGEGKDKEEGETGKDRDDNDGLFDKGTENQGEDEAITEWSNLSDSLSDTTEDADPAVTWDEETLERHQEEERRERECTQRLEALRSEVLRQQESCLAGERKRVGLKLVELEACVAGVKRTLTTHQTHLAQLRSQHQSVQAKAEVMDSGFSAELKALRDTAKGLSKFQKEVEELNLRDSMPKMADIIKEYTKKLEMTVVEVWEWISKQEEGLANHETENAAYKAKLTVLEAAINQVRCDLQFGIVQSGILENEKDAKQVVIRADIDSLAWRLAELKSLIDCQDRKIEEARDQSAEQMGYQAEATLKEFSGRDHQMQSLRDELKEMTERFQVIERENMTLKGVVRDQIKFDGKVHREILTKLRRLEDRTNDLSEQSEKSQAKQTKHEEKIQGLSALVGTVDFDALSDRFKSLERSAQSVNNSIKNIWNAITDKIEPAVGALQLFKMKTEEAPNSENNGLRAGNNQVPTLVLTPFCG